MKEALVSKGPKVEIVDSPIPSPNADQVVIKVVVSGSNPKDWKVPYLLDRPTNQGDDIAGVVHSVGENVTEFKVGDRVAAFHQMVSPHGSYAEYALAWQHTTFHIPKSISFEEAATLPLAAMTAAVGLYKNLGIASPWKPATTPTPLVIYGAASAVGAFVLQFALRSNIHPIIAIAGKGAPFVESFIDRSKGDTIVDYRNGDEAVVKGIRDALQGQKLELAYDAVSEKGSYQNICQVLEPNGKITLVLPGKKYPEIPATVEQTITQVGCVHDDAKDFGFVYFRLIGKGVADGWFKPHPHEVRAGGLAGIQGALEDLRDGKASAVKYVFRIADTEGVEKSSL